MELYQILALAVVVGVYAAFSLRLVHRATAALVGALLLAGFFGPRLVGMAFVPDVLLVTAGLMVVAGAVKRSGLAAWLALQAARLAGGRPAPLLVGVALVAYVFGALLGPAPAVVLVVPVALLIAVELDVAVLPFLSVLSWSSLLGGASLYTAQPANLWLAAALGVQPAHWLASVGPLALGALAVTLLTAFFVYRKQLRVTNERRARVLEFEPARSLGSRAEVGRTLAVLGLVAAGLVAVNLGLPVPASLVALGGAVLVLLLDDRQSLDKGLASLDGGLLLFYGALMVVVAGLAGSGAASLLGGTSPPPPAALLAGSALLGAFVDHGAVLAALIPWLQAWGPGPWWVAAVLGTTVGAGVTVWGSASVASALALGGQGKGAPTWKQYTAHGGVFGAVNLVFLALLLTLAG